MFGQLEDAAVIDALALEYRRSIMQGVTQDVDIGILPVDQFAIEPDGPGRSSNGIMDIL